MKNMNNKNFTFVEANKSKNKVGDILTFLSNKGRGGAMPYLINKAIKSLFAWDESGDPYDLIQTKKTLNRAINTGYLMSSHRHEDEHLILDFINQLEGTPREILQDIIYNYLYDAVKNIKILLKCYD